MRGEIAVYPSRRIISHLKKRREIAAAAAHETFACTRTVSDYQVTVFRRHGNVTDTRLAENLCKWVGD